MMDYGVVHVFIRPGVNFPSLYNWNLLCLKHSCLNTNGKRMTGVRRKPLMFTVFVQTGFVFSIASELVVGF